MADVTLDTTTTPRVATIRLDRPPMNAISRQTTEELDASVAELEGRDDIGAVVIWGGPKVFAAGADVKEFPDLDRAGALALSQRLNEVFDRLAGLPQPVIAAVNGFALGGGFELALTADFMLLGESARLGLPEIQLGLIPGGGGTQRLSRLVGPMRAKHLVFTGRHVKAPEALELGIALAVHPDDDVYDAALALAASLAAGAASMRIAKRVIDAGAPLGMAEALAVETEGFADCFDTEDARTGILSFMENGPGKATFSGR
ncbi:MAG: enoyl-CoA hydratase/isomerase family protein [Acidimicrobiales bacterium]|nr:enoyl-CoA hydratase/isomerase family protein [Acidimicrobiales bacterium]